MRAKPDYPVKLLNVIQTRTAMFNDLSQRTLVQAFVHWTTVMTVQRPPTKDALRTLVQASVHWTTVMLVVDIQMKRLQSEQNTAAHLLSAGRRRDITPFYKASTGFQ